MALKTALKKKLHDAERIALLGIGSQLRGDDACGVLIAKDLKKSIPAFSGRRVFKVFIGDTAPENVTGQIKKFNPTHLILIDAADIGKKAGQARLISPDETSGISFCTHQLPLKILVDYLTWSIGCKVIIIGIQPKSLDFGKSPSRQIKEAMLCITAIFREILEIK